jgi:hypothetical protein
MSKDLIIIPLTYFGPVQLYTKFLLEGQPVIEQYDNYIKQTYRNRCVISGANGPVNLTIPVKRKHGIKNHVKDILVDYDTDWTRLHWKGIISSYNSSPFFEFYRDTVEPFYVKRYKFLVDLCFGIIIEMLNALNIQTDVSLSTKYMFPGEGQIRYDFRELISPKKDFTEDDLFYPVPYQQVFMEKTGFIPNLSIIDILFNMGSESKGILQNSLKINMRLDQMSQK